MYFNQKWNRFRDLRTYPRRSATTGRISAKFLAVFSLKIRGLPWNFVHKTATKSSHINNINLFYIINKNLQRETGVYGTLPYGYGRKTSLKSPYRKPAPLSHQTLVLYLKIKAIKTFKFIYKKRFWGLRSKQRKERVLDRKSVV